MVASDHGDAQTKADQATISFAIDAPGDTADRRDESKCRPGRYVFIQVQKPHFSGKGDTIQTATGRLTRPFQPEPVEQESQVVQCGSKVERHRFG
jgi:hypothetical protein